MEWIGYGKGLLFQFYLNKSIERVKGCLEVDDEGVTEEGVQEDSEGVHK